MLKCAKTLWRPGLRPGPCWGSSQRSPDPLAGGEGAGCPLPKNPTAALGPAGLELRPQGPKHRPPPPLGISIFRSWQLCQRVSENMFTFQHDSTPAHRAQDMIELLHCSTLRVLAPDMWPPNSSVLNPVDYAIWSIMQNFMSAF